MTIESLLFQCPSCKAFNRVMPDRLSAHPKCGKCGKPLTILKAPVNATSAGFEDEVLKWPGYVLLEFWSKFCPYCKMVEPVIHDMADWRAGHLKIVKVEINEEPGMAQQYKIDSTPTFFLYRKGTQIASMKGAPKEKIELVQWIDRFLK